MRPECSPVGPGAAWRARARRGRYRPNKSTSSIAIKASAIQASSCEVMKRLKLTMACGRYDRTQPLIDGRVGPEGVDLTFIPLRPGETFWRMLNHAEFDCSEMSLSSYTFLRSEGDTRFIAIPVFPSRVFRHSAVYLRADSKIETPQDLKGKRIGVGDYQMTAAVWVRGFLKSEDGVVPEDVTWGLGRPVRTINPPAGIRIEAMPAETTLEAMLERGEIDALASV